jgi:hypothetical protein
MTVRWSSFGSKKHTIVSLNSNRKKNTTDSYENRRPIPMNAPLIDIIGLSIFVLGAFVFSFWMVGRIK